MTQNTKQAKELVAFYSKMRGTKSLTVHGLFGTEGDRETIVTKLTFSELSEHFKLVPTNDAPEGVMLQRELAKSRGRGIAKYIKENNDFIFPELIAVVERLSIEKHQSLSGVCTLTLSPDCFRYLVDGQGRLFGIGDVLNALPEYSEQTVDIKFVESRGVDADAQIFTDVNKTPVSPNASQCIAMDTRQTLSKFSKEAVLANPALHGRVDFSKASVTGSSSASTIWTLNQFSKFLQLLTGTTAKSAETLFDEKAQREKWIAFINKFFEQIKANDFIANTLELGRGEWTKQSVVPTSVFLKSLALYGKVILMKFAAENKQKADWSFIDKFKDIDFSLDNSEWVGRCLNYRNRFEDKSFNHKAVASYLCQVTGLEVPEELETIEEEVLMARASIMKQKRQEAKSGDETEIREVV